MFTKYLEAKKNILQEETILELNRAHEKGTVYTPETTSREMVYLLILDYLSRNNPLTLGEDEILKSIYLNLDLNALELYKPSEVQCVDARHLFEKIKALRILDLACGTGLLLLAYLELQLVVMTIAGISNSDKMTFMTAMLSEKVFAFDINEEALRNFKSVLVTLMACLGSHEPIDESNFFLGNSLIVNMDIKVDLVIGNPPYIGEKGNLEIFKRVKRSDFGSKYYEGKMDYFYFFVYKAYDYLEENGSLCYLTSNYFFTADGAVKLRQFIQEHFNFTQILNFNGLRVFKKKNLHACIYTLTPTPQKTIKLLDEYLNLTKMISTEDIYHRTGTFHFISDENASEILSLLDFKLNQKLEDSYDIKQGIVSGADRNEGMPVFVYKACELDAIPQALKQNLKPFYKNSDIKHFKHEDQTPFFILYSDKTIKETALLEKLLEPHRAKLEKRREVVNKVRKWYELTWPRDKSLFSKPKIVVPQRAKSNYFAYSDNEFYASADVYYILPKCELDEIALKGLTAFLNSYIVLLYLYYKGKRKGEALELYASPLKTIPYATDLIERLSEFYDLDVEIEVKMAEINDVIYDYLNLSNEKRMWLNNFGRKFL